MEIESREAVRTFLADLMARKGDTREFSNSDSLVFSGRLQSVDVVEIVLFLEREFGLNFAEIDFDQSRFDSVDEIAALIAENSPAA